MKKIILIFLITTAVATMNAQNNIIFEQIDMINSTAGIANGSIAFSDVDNDGDEDVLITGRNQANMPITELYLNFGMMKFAKVVETPFVGVYGGSIAFSDVDNDGDEDVLITGGPWQSSISKLYTNDGLGNFTEVIGTPFIGVAFGSIAFSDIDNDGDEDVLITGKTTANVTITKLYNNDGLGVFTEVIGTPFVGVFESSIAFSDIDNDGDEDVLITGMVQANVTITKLYTNDGLGVFTEVIGTPITAVHESSIAFSDIDNDGDEDVLITGSPQANVYITKLYTNDGLGVFTEVIGTPFLGVAYSSLEFTDIDGDNDQDVLITGLSGTTVSSKLYTNNGLGVFTEVIGTPFTAVYVGSIAFSDVDNDGDEDVLITGNDQANFIIELYTNDGLGNFIVVDLNSFDGVSQGSIAFSDVDNDGDEDVLITGIDQANVHITELHSNDGFGNFTEVIGTPFIGVSQSSIVFSDVDNDGDEDVLITGLDQANVTIAKLYTNDGLGNFTEVIGAPFVGAGESAIAFSDVDNDGDEDVLITGYDGQSQISKLYTNDGLGNFTEVIGTPFVEVYFGSIAFSDVDNDGDEDVLITGHEGQSLISKLYSNDGLGNFTEVIGTPFLGVYFSSIAFSDIDNDGDEDVLITGNSQSNGPITKLYTNDGLGIFTEVIGTPFVVVGRGAIAFTDVDNDEDEDVLITGKTPANVTITKLYTNDGLGVFTEVIGTPFFGAYDSSVAFSDVDNDGDEDVLITGWDAPFGNGTAKLYKNLYHLGCTDLLACNYDATAALDDSSCVYTNTTNTNIVTCDTYLWNGTAYNQSGTYDSTFTNMNGCDSIVSLNLTINNATTSIDVQTACSNYTWIDGITYSQTNNIATYITLNSAGCDSIISLDLTIYNNSSNFIESSCGSYLWNGIAYTQSGTYDSTFTNMNGCDSVSTLFLTIYNESITTDVQIACDTYTWVDGLTYTASTNAATYTTINANGCDSVITLDLIITGFPTAVVTQNGIDLEVTSATSYLWSSTETTQDITPTANGWYWCIVTDVNGCESDTAFYEVTNIVSSIEDILSDKAMIYPNPTKDYIVIETEYIITQVKVIDAQARIVDVLVKGKTIDVSGIANGLYFVEIYTDKGLVRKQFVKH